MKIHQIVKLLITCTGVIATTAFAAEHPPGAITPKATELKIGYQPLASPGGGLMEVIRRDRIFQKELHRKGIRLKPVPTNSGGESATLLKESSLDASFTGDMPTIELALSTPIIVIGPVKRNYAAVVSKRGVTPRELKGKKIGYVYATSGHYALLRTIQNGGLSERDVTLVEIDVNRMPEALINGKVDAIAAWEPTPSALIAKYPDRFSVTGRQNSTSYLVISRKFATQNPDTAYQLVAALTRAINWLARDSANQKRAADWNHATLSVVAGNPTHFTADDLYKQLSSDILKMRHVAGGLSVTEDGNRLLADEFDFLKSIGKLPRTAQWETINKSFGIELMDRIQRNPSVSLINRYDYDLK